MKLYKHVHAHLHFLALGVHVSEIEPGFRQALLGGYALVNRRSFAKAVACSCQKMSLTLSRRRRLPKAFEIMPASNLSRLGLG